MFKCKISFLDKLNLQILLSTASEVVMSCIQLWLATLMLQFCWGQRVKHEGLPSHFSDSLLCHPAPELWDEGLIFPCAVFPSNPLTHHVSHVFLHVQGWTVWSYCFYLRVQWAGLCKAAAELYHVPVLHTTQKFFWVQADTLIFFPHLFLLFPHCKGQQWKLCMFYVKYRV